MLDEFENPPEVQLTWLNRTLEGISIKLPRVEAICGEVDAMPITDDVPTDWDHVIWFVHGRLPPDFSGPRVNGRAYVRRPSFVLSFRVLTYNHTDGTPRLGYGVGCLRVYPGFEVEQVALAYRWILGKNPVSFAHYLADKMGKKPKYDHTAKDATLTPTLVGQCLDPLRGTTLLLGPDELTRVMAYGERRQ